MATYELEIPQEDGNMKKVLCNEHGALMKACEGNRKGGQECGLRICNEKYMFLRNSEYNGVKFAIMSREGQGGGCVAKTKSALVIGVFAKDAKNSLGMNQNIG